MATVAQDLRVAVVGASLGGLSVANVLHRCGAKVDVFELFPAGFHSRGGALGSVDVDLLREIRGGQGDDPKLRAIRGHGHFYGDLWTYLYEGLPEGTVTFGADVREIRDAQSQQPSLVVASTTGDRPLPYDLIIGADGGKSTVRRYVTDAEPKYSGYTVWRGLVPTRGVPGPPSGSANVNGTQYATLGFPVRGAEGVELWNCGIYMAMPEAEVAPPARNRQVGAEARTLPPWFLPLVARLFDKPSTAFWAACAEGGKVTQHPVWEFAAPSLVKGRVALLGDAAHMATPRTGAGAYTAMVDAVSLGQAVRRAQSLDQALQLYNEDGAKRARELLRRSQELGRDFAPPGAASVSPAALLQALDGGTAKPRSRCLFC